MLKRFPTSIGLACIILMLIALVAVAESAPSGAVVHSYNITSDGDNIGNLTVTKKAGPNAGEVIIKSKTDINISGMMWDWFMELDSRMTFKDTVIQNYTHTLAQKDESPQSMKGKRKGSILEASLTADGRTTNVTMSDDKYDATEAGLPAYLMKNRPAKPGTGIRLLDTVAFDIFTYTLLKHGQETVTVHGKKIDCLTFTLRTPEGTSTYWLAEDSFSAYLVKEVGTDEDGPYAILPR